MQTIDELRRLQAQPLEKKIVMTSQRIRQWVERYGEDGVSISFSGGKDSTVLLDIVRNVCGYKNVTAVFVDVPTQYPELKTFAEKFENLTILKPKMGFYQVCDKYGFPLIGKEVSGSVYDAKRFLEKVKDKENSLAEGERITGFSGFADMLGKPWKVQAMKNGDYQRLKEGIIPREIDHLYEAGKKTGTAPVRLLSLYGEVIHKEKGVV